jgi:hypothetical protein
VFFDALVEIRDEGLVKKQFVYLAIGLRPSRHKKVPGLWIEQSEGRQVLAARHERDRRPMYATHRDRRGQWPQGPSRGDYGGVSRHRMILTNLT